MIAPRLSGARSRGALILASTLLLGAAVGTALNQQARETQVRELEQRWLERENDPDALETILADDFVHVLRSGFVTKTEQLNYMRTHPAAPRPPGRFEELHVRLFGDVAIATGIVDSAPADGTPSTRTVFTDVFLLRRGKWTAVNAQEIDYDPAGRR